ncbi:hypothetical protein TRICI_000380 [Trichomonascus ciferrii]|uniref:Uncharacterized protein n=1 Tax=Trichomonascus ciferrii TaxID=44093 RepID=A0A642VDK7_9ASCO|nr:hypothetical protein TRICI_000380 [Trichomonascus ciferrii]
MSEEPSAPSADKEGSSSGSAAGTKHALDDTADADIQQQTKRRNVDEENDDDAMLDFAADEQLRFLAQHLESVDDGESSHHQPQQEPQLHVEEPAAAAAPRDPSPEPQPQQQQKSPESEQPVVEAPKSSSSRSANASDPHVQLCVNSLPVLDNLATQILMILARGSSSQDTLLKAVVEPESSEGVAFRRMLDVFEQVKRIYTTEPFLVPPEVDETIAKTGKQRAILQRANLTTFVCAIFGSTQVGFFHLNKYFIDAFVGENGRLLKSQGALYLELKTQAYISAMKQDQQEEPLEETLNELFPDDIDKMLLERKTRSRALVPSEIDFANRCRKRRENLQAESSADELSEKYDWLNFVRDLHDYVAKNIAQLVNENACRCDLDAPENKSPLGPEHTNNRPSYHVWHSQISNRRRPEPRNNRAASVVKQPHADSTSDQHGTATAHNSARTAVGGGGGGGHAPSTTSSRTGTQYHRRPWTREEEAALMHGLEKVQGAHWSQILELHGAGGTISEVLKDRTQVQLKDKARNLKLYFIKGGHEIPPVLKYVTGDNSRRGKKKAAATTTTSNTTTTNGEASPATTATSTPAPATPVQPPAAPQPSSSAEMIDPELESQLQKDQQQPPADHNQVPADDHDTTTSTTNIEELLQSVGDFINSRSKPYNNDNDNDENVSKALILNPERSEPWCSAPEISQHVRNLVCKYPPIRRTYRDMAENSDPGDEEHTVTYQAVDPEAYMVNASRGHEFTPRNFKEAMSYHDREEWKAACDSEMEAHHISRKWELCPLPKSKKATGCKWVMKIKYNQDGIVDKYKSRLVAQGS